MKPAEEAPAMAGTGSAEPVQPPEQQVEPSPAPTTPVVAPQPPRPVRRSAKKPDPAAIPAVEQLARQLRVPSEEITVLQVARAEWPNTCLGLPADGEICGQMITPGYAISLEANGQRYEFRTDEAGQRVRLASAPRPGIGKPLVTWRDSRSFNTLVIGTEQVSFGLRGGAMLTVPLGVPERARDLKQFLATFGPFQARTEAGEVEFAGVGSLEADATVQRLIAEWARLVWTEADQGRSEPILDQALEWRRQGGRPGSRTGFCDKVIVSRAGTATAWSCRSGEDRLVARLALSNEQLSQLYAWLDHFEHVVLDTTDPAMAEKMSVAIILDGQGVDVPDETDREAIAAFANAIVRELLVAPAR